MGTLACTGKSLDTGLEPIGIRSAEPDKWSPEGDINNIVFPSGVQVGDVTATQGFVSLQTVAEQVTWQLMQADGDKWVEHSNGAEVPEEETVQFELLNLQADTAYCIVCFNGEQESVVQ